MDDLRAEIEALLSKIPVDFGGGCSVSKAHLMAHLIRKFRLHDTLDIGVYRGRSFFPQALAHAPGPGRVYGVDPWLNSEAVQNDRPELKDLLDRFAAETDFEAIYREVERFQRESGLAAQAVIVRKTSREAARSFAEAGMRFGLIHIDGNHDTAAVTADAQAYYPLLAEGGFLVLDDVSWRSVRPAYEWAGERMRRVYERVNEDRGDDYAVFWKTGSWFKAHLLALKLRWVGRD